MMFRQCPRRKREKAVQGLGKSTFLCQISHIRNMRHLNCWKQLRICVAEKGFHPLRQLVKPAMSNLLTLMAVEQRPVNAKYFSMGIEEKETYLCISAVE